MRKAATYGHHVCKPATRRTDAGGVRRTYATVTDSIRSWKPGDKVNGFTVRRTKDVPELHLTALDLQHDKTGAECLHIARDDANNVFAINFKTNPEDDTGLPHILEHVTLCGSEKYPVRDPFFKMMPRSLANFMNAFTSSDYTSYPFATTNKQDFKNLTAVYLDATLHPLLTRSDFLQEGWRLGPEDPKEVATRENVQFKGVVYNEMKGQMSDASYLFYVRFRDKIFPDLFNSGGDPGKMTELTHEQLTRFSRRHYHPSNARLFSYGDLDLREHLKVINADLEPFERIERDATIKLPRSLEEGPLEYDFKGPVDTMQPPDRQTKSSITWAGPETSDIHENFSISIAMALLMNGFGSPLYQGLIETGLGTNFSPNSGYDGSAKRGLLTIGLDGMKDDDVANLRQTIQSALRDGCDEGFQEHKVEGYMHQLEIALKHKTPNFGMGVLEKTLPGWFNGVDPLKGLSWNETIFAFRERLKEPQYLQQLVQRYFMNEKCMQFTMRPWDGYATSIEENEQQRRERALARLEEAASSPEAAISNLGQQELDLLHEQESAPMRNIDSLPTLRADDISRQMEKKPVTWATMASSRVLWRETSTNGLTYFQAQHSFKDLPDDLRLMLPLFTDCLMRLGSKEKSVGDLEAEILLKTGGISISPFSTLLPNDLQAIHEGLTFDGYALDKNVDSMFDLLRQLVLEIDFSSDKASAAVLELLEAKASGALDGVAEAGNRFATGTAAASLLRQSSNQAQLSGLPQVEHVARLLQAAREDPSSLQGILAGLKMLQSIAISNTDALSCRIVCEPSQRSTNETRLQNFLSTLPSHPPIPPHNLHTDSTSGSSLSRRAFFNLPFQVSYTGTCLNTQTTYSSPDKGPLMILSQLLTHNYLHPEVREKGGAYGASASSGSISPLFSMSSYRDPNPRQSLRVFAAAGQFARDRAWTARELEESKLSLFQGVDAPTSPMSDGSVEFTYGITGEMRQRRREELLDVKKEDVWRVAEKYLVKPAAEDVGVCLLGPKKSWVNDEVDGHGRKWDVKTLAMTNGGAA